MKRKLLRMLFHDSPDIFPEFMCENSLTGCVFVFYNLKSTQRTHNRRKAVKSDSKDCVCELDLFEDSV